MTGRFRPVQERGCLQRFFTAFPGGWPGAGLLVLRLATGSGILIQSSRWFHSFGDATATSWGLSAAGLVSALALLIGFITPLAGAAAAAVSMAATISSDPTIGRDQIGVALLVANAIALSLLGPGAMSIDAWIFGRREVVIPAGSETRRQ